MQGLVRSPLSTLLLLFILGCTAQGKGTAHALCACGVVLYDFSIIAGEFIRPLQHTLPNGLTSLSGSDANGGCPQDCMDNVNICQCSGNVPTNSTLIDGVCPTSVDTTEPTWARDFFTINRNGETQVIIGFNWNTGFMLRGIELKLFNCASLLNTDIRTINVWGSTNFPTFNPTSLVGSYAATNGDDLNCNSVTTIVIPTVSMLNFRTYYIEFEFEQRDSNAGIYIAEARFSDTTITIPNEVTSSPPSPAVTSTPQQPSPSSTITSVPVPMMSSTDTTLFSSPVATVMIAPIQTSSSNRLSSTIMQLITTPTPTSTPIGLPPSTDPSTDTVPPTTSPLTNPPTTDLPPASSDSQLGAIAGSLAGVIIVLIIVIVTGVIILVFCLNKNRRKVDLQNLQGAISETNGRNHQMNRQSLANNEYYEEALHGRGGTMNVDGYFDVNINDSSTEPLYHTVSESKTLHAETIANEQAAVYYDNIKETVKVPPYSKLAVKEPPLVPKKTPELYRDLKIQDKLKQSTDSLVLPPVVVFNEHGAEVETVENFGDDENTYQGLSESASVHSFLAVLTKPVLSMDSNPTYESPDAIEPPKVDLSDEMYANPDAIDRDSRPDSIYTDTVAPPKPLRSHNASLTEADEIYTDIDKDSALSATGQNAGRIHHAPLNTTVEDIYTNHDLPTPRGENMEVIYSDADTLPPAEVIYSDADTLPPAEVIYSDADTLLPTTLPPAEVIYSDADTLPPTNIALTQDGIYSMSEDDPNAIYIDPDARKTRLDHLPAIYDTIHQESAVASIFDPDSNPVYENTISDENLFPYAPIYIDTAAASEVKTLELTPDNICKGKTLGSGCFGLVVLAETVGLSLKDLRMSDTDDDSTKSTQVAVKTLKASASSSTRESFEKECKFMSRLNHPHVIRFLGVCKTDSPYIMMEYLKYGDLNKYLQKFDTIVDFETQNPVEISVATLIRMCTQIADAMDYLASHNYIHRDLAARNCLVGDSNIVKLSDFGMSRSLYESHYYIIKGRAILPVRWMASECFYGKFSVNSDIWAFGVTMWEVFVLSKELPYKDLSDSEVAMDALKGAKRRSLPRPESCPQEVFDIMLQCLTYLPKARATFDQLFKELSSLIENTDNDECV